MTAFSSRKKETLNTVSNFYLISFNFLSPLTLFYEMCNFAMASAILYISSFIYDLYVSLSYSLCLISTLITCGHYSPSQTKDSILKIILISFLLIISFLCYNLRQDGRTENTIGTRKAPIIGVI